MYRIRYEGICIQGDVRINNEDNLLWAGRCLPLVHGDMREGLSGIASPEGGAWFAVFDGMGGEVFGEAASYIAAREMVQQEKLGAAGCPLDETALCRMMNRKILDYAKANHAGGMGTTVAALRFAPEKITGFNLGDSRCYVFSGGELQRLSEDHTVVSPLTGRGQLTQCLGIPEEEFLLEPALFSFDPEKSCSFLLCTDGLTGAVGDLCIQTVLSGKGSLKEKLHLLTDAVCRKGAEDNTTILLFEIM